ncbi:hypothetical protein Purlil1_12692 [Purpureocillium lilacinum]|uniref:Uncharacterized protein n=1 Tax=Purpureocillium lilacinum TaxID=33203 RepID=A0ABR0BG77_PURLI|nr:hypothetical protein Purlil1_12692 [Purpureocillium lilacinum]
MCKYCPKPPNWAGICIWDSTPRPTTLSRAGNLASTTPMKFRALAASIFFAASLLPRDFLINLPSRPGNVEAARGYEWLDFLDPDDRRTVCLIDMFSDLASFPWRDIRIATPHPVVYDPSDSFSRQQRPHPLSLHEAFISLHALRCIWVVEERYTCHCTIVYRAQRPTLKCSKVFEQGTQKWDGFCNHPQCPRSEMQNLAAS